MTSHSTRDAKKKWLIVIAVPGLALLLWLVGVGAFRQSARAPTAASRAIPTPPAVLNSAQDYLARGDYDVEMGEYERALAAYTRAIELKPDFAEAYNNRAYVYMKLEKYDPALADLDKALELRPDYVNALMNRGDIYNYYYQIDRARALADYDRVLAIDPDSPNTTSVCGHRMLAYHDGWSLGAFVEVLTHGVHAGCPSPAD